MVYFFEQVMPDPFVLSIGLTVFVAILAAIFAPRGSAPVILNSWYTGTFNILAFAFQMILILATGFAVADAAIVRVGLRRLAAHVRSPVHAVLLLFPVVAVAAWLNWGLGLVVAAFLRARSHARRGWISPGWSPAVIPPGRSAITASPAPSHSPGLAWQCAEFGREGDRPCRAAQ